MQLYEEVYAECDKYADVEAVIVPPPPDNLPMHEPGRVFIKVANTEQAMKCKKVFDGRLFDNKKVQVGAPASHTCSSHTWLAAALSYLKLVIPGLGQPFACTYVPGLCRRRQREAARSSIPQGPLAVASLCICWFSLLVLPSLH